MTKYNKSMTVCHAVAAMTVMLVVVGCQPPKAFYNSTEQAYLELIPSQKKLRKQELIYLANNGEVQDFYYLLFTRSYYFCGDSVEGARTSKRKIAGLKEATRCLFEGKYVAIACNEHGASPRGYQSAKYKAGIFSLAGIFSSKDIGYYKLSEHDARCFAEHYDASEKHEVDKDGFPLLATMADPQLGEDSKVSVLGYIERMTIEILIISIYPELTKQEIRSDTRYERKFHREGKPEIPVDKKQKAEQQTEKPAGQPKK